MPTILDEIAEFTRARMREAECTVPTEELAEQARAMAAAELAEQARAMAAAELAAGVDAGQGGRTGSARLRTTYETSTLQKDPNLGQSGTPVGAHFQCARDASGGDFTFPFEAALAAPGLSFICEAKKASPSKGLIAPDFPYLDIARSYEAAGAAAISCLTEPHWFMGADEYLAEIAGAVAIPVLRKDFTVSERMIFEAKVLGASAVLLICAILTDEELVRFRELADELGMSALVEAHDEGEIERALACGARVIGVNNRNLKDFTVDFDNASRLRSLVPEGVAYVAESGVTSADDVAAIAALGADAVLVGEALMRSADKSAKLDEFRAAAAKATATPSRHPERSAEGAKSKDLPAVKFCGITCVEDAEAASALEVRPDYAGLVFWEKSKRHVGKNEAQAIRDALDDDIRTVGVFVDADAEFVAQLLGEGIISIAQLHGHEDETYIERLRGLAPGAEVWKAFLVKGTDDVVAACASSADMVLVDGGLGQGCTFDWSLLSGIDRPFVLAGGLACDNVGEAVRHLHPAAVDVSSGIERPGLSADGRTRKDPEKMRAFMEAVMRC